MQIIVQDMLPENARSAGTMTVGQPIPVRVSGAALTTVTRADGTRQNLYPIVHQTDGTSVVITGTRQGGTQFRGTLNAFLAEPGVTMNVGDQFQVLAGFTGADSASGKTKAGTLVAVKA